MVLGAGAEDHHLGGGALEEPDEVVAGEALGAGRARGDDDAVELLFGEEAGEGVTVGAAAGIRADINRAYAAVRSPQTYDPASFRAALGKAAASIGALR